MDVFALSVCTNLIPFGFVFHCLCLEQNHRYFNSFCFCRDEKDKWIRAKYELCEFLPPLPHGDIALSQASWYVVYFSAHFWYVDCCKVMVCIKIFCHWPGECLSVVAWLSFVANWIYFIIVTLFTGYFPSFLELPSVHHDLVLDSASVCSELCWVCH